MKTAILNIDNTTQIMLVPETDIDKEVVEHLLSKLPKNYLGTTDIDAEGSVQIGIKSGGFSECVGGWYRHYNDSGVIIRIDNKEKEVIKK